MSASMRSSRDRGSRFTVEDMAVQAAIAGQGVALVSSALVADDLARGGLVRPFPEAGDQATEFCYFLVYPEAYLQRSKVAAFRDWVKAEVAGGPASP